MVKNSLYFVIFSILALSATSWNNKEVLAQSIASSSESEKCIQGLVKEGLKSTEASVWCNYEQECLVQSQEQGLPMETAKTVCQCSISEFKSKYNTDKFKELTQQVDSNKNVAKELREVGEMCFEKILFE